MSTALADRTEVGPRRRRGPASGRVALPVAVPILVAALCVSVVAAVMIGPVPVPAGTVLRSLSGSCARRSRRS